MAWSLIGSQKNDAAVRRSRPALCAALTGTLIGTLALAGCIPGAPQPTPGPTTAPALPPAPVAQQLPTPVYSNWIDAPQTPGDWRYAAGQGAIASIARFGASAPVFALACLPAARTVRLQRLGSAATASSAMIIRTEFGERTLVAQALDGGPAVDLPASDPFLEAMAFSKGRFAIETTGAPALFLPAWPEVSRVIEDCRSGKL